MQSSITNPVRTIMKTYTFTDITLQAAQVGLEAGTCFSFVGVDGQGKTDVLGQLVRARKTPSGESWGFGCCIGTQVDSTDVGGVPVIVPPDGGLPLVVKVPMSVFKEAIEYGKMGVPYVIFFDEENLSPPTVRGSMLSVKTGGIVGDQILPPTTRFVAAFNPPAMSVGGADYMPPECTRTTWLPFHMDYENWFRYMSTGEGPEIFRVPDNWKEAVPKGEDLSYLQRARSLVLGFCGKNRALFNEGIEINQDTFEIEGDLSKYINRPRGVPRTWAKLMELIACAEQMNLPNQEVVIRLLAQGTVGEAAGGEFMAYRKTASLLPDWKDVIRGTAELPTRQDLVYTLASTMSIAMLELVKQEHKDAPELWNGCGRVFAEYYKRELGDIVYPAVIQILSNRPKLPNGIDPAWGQFSGMVRAFREAE